MKIYLVINDTTHNQSITACEWLAKYQKKRYVEQGEECRVIVGELKTQGVNFCTWAQFSGEIDDKKK